MAAISEAAGHEVLDAGFSDEDIGDSGVGSSVRLKEIVIHTFEDTLWWLEALSAMLLDRDSASPTQRLAPAYLLSRIRYVLDVFREQLANRHLALDALRRRCGAESSGAARQLQLDYRLLFPGIRHVDGCAARVAKECPVVTDESKHALAWLVNELVDRTQTALLGEQTLVLRMHADVAGDGP